jgi:hypothetical protein
MSSSSGVMTVSLHDVQPGDEGRHQPAGGRQLGAVVPYGKAALTPSCGQGEPLFEQDVNRDNRNGLVCSFGCRVLPTNVY